MFKEVIPENALGLINAISGRISDFYLAGGTGLALQLGHRLSEDFDFFKCQMFSAEALEASIAPDRVISVRPGTLHCIKEGIRLSFLFYDVPLCYPSHRWGGLDVAAWQDIVAEKMKTVSQRGSKKDFWDVYSVISSCSSIEEVTSFFLKRFKEPEINRYHVLKSLVYFEDAESDPDPILLVEGQSPSWNQVKQFFVDNIKAFEKALLPKIDAC